MKRNVKTGDIVLVVDEKLPRGSWPMGKVTQTFPDKFGLVRKVMVKTQFNEILRPISKLCMILENEV